jgi:hypothetical protein
MLPAIPLTAMWKAAWCPVNMSSATKLPAIPIRYPAQWICGDERRNAMKNGREKRKAKTSSLVELFCLLVLEVRCSLAARPC